MTWQLVLIPEQDEALRRLYQREVAEAADVQRPPIWRDLDHARECVKPGYGCVMIQWCGMWLGIEPDGYTHS